MFGGGGGDGGASAMGDGGMGGSAGSSSGGGMDMKKMGAGLQSFGAMQQPQDPRMGGMMPPAMMAMGQPQQSQGGGGTRPGSVLSMSEILARGAKYNRRGGM